MKQAAAEADQNMSAKIQKYKTKIANLLAVLNKERSERKDDSQLSREKQLIQTQLEASEKERTTVQEEHDRLYAKVTELS